MIAKVDENELYTLWEPIAKDKDPGFEWQPSYAKKRGQTYDSDELAKYARGLKALGTVAPNGFPNHKSLRRVMELLHTKFEIFTKTDKNETVFTMANTAADVWRTMLGHCVMYKRKDGQWKKSTLVNELSRLGFVVARFTNCELCHGMLFGGRVHGS